LASGSDEEPAANGRHGSAQKTRSRAGASGSGGGGGSAQRGGGGLAAAAKAALRGVEPELFSPEELLSTPGSGERSAWCWQALHGQLCCAWDQLMLCIITVAGVFYFLCCFW
jgi:hypothetical protein